MSLPTRARTKLLDLPTEALELVVEWLSAADFASFSRAARDCHTAVAGATAKVAGKEIVRLLAANHVTRESISHMPTLCGKCPNLVLPSSVEYIFNDAFVRCHSLRSLEALGVQRVGAGAFLECSGLKSVRLPRLVSLGDLAFSYCTSLAAVDLPASVEAIPDAAFAYCESLNSISIPGVSKIGENTFYECRKLTTVKLSSKLVTVKSHAFAHCSALVHIDLPESLTSIRAEAFRDCLSIDDGTRARVVAMNARAAPPIHTPLFYDSHSV